MIHRDETPLENTQYQFGRLPIEAEATFLGQLDGGGRGWTVADCNYISEGVSSPRLEPVRQLRNDLLEQFSTVSLLVIN